MSIDERLHEVVASVLGVSAGKLTDEDTPDTLASWDSVTHIQLVIALEAEFAIELSPEEIGELRSIGAIRSRIHAEMSER